MDSPEKVHNADSPSTLLYVLFFTFLFFAAAIEYIHRALDILLGQDDTDALGTEHFPRPPTGAGGQQGETIVERVSQLLPPGLTAARRRSLTGFEQTG